MKWIVVVLLVQVFAYTWAHLVLSYKAGLEIAPTTSSDFYRFCGAEAGFLALLRSFAKDKKTDEQEGEEQHEQQRDFSEADQP